MALVTYNGMPSCQTAVTVVLDWARSCSTDCQHSVNRSQNTSIYLSTH